MPGAPSRRCGRYLPNGGVIVTPFQGKRNATIFDSRQGIDRVSMPRNSQKPWLPEEVFNVPSSILILPEGDSITNGNGDSEAINEGGYRQALGDWMNTNPFGCDMNMIGPYNNFFPNGQGAHNGLVGSTISDHISTLPGHLTGSYPADLLLMMLGTNDLGSVSAATALSRMSTLLAAARTAKPSIKIILATIVDNMDTTEHDRGVEYNAGLPAVVASENSAGGHVDLIDINSAVGPWSFTNFYDAAHPNAVGYERMVAVWQAAISYRITHWS